MTGEVTQILRLYEELDWSIEDIAEDRESDITSIKAVLAQFSSKYQKLISSKEYSADKDFTDEELVLANKAITSIMLGTEDENLKFRAAKYLRQDKKGRLDAAKAMRGLNVNVFMFNEQMKRARLSQLKTRGISNGENSGAPIQEIKEVQEVE